MSLGNTNPTTVAPAAPDGTRIAPPRDRIAVQKNRGGGGGSQIGAARRDQLLCLAVAAFLLVAIFFLQPVINRQRARLVGGSDRSMGNLGITLPKLALGGFRGIMAAVIWEHAENDKNQRKWVPLETDYNIISKLEPYFGSAYVFNAWNQSYNLSAQFHNEAQKYKWVLDGLVYLMHGERYNPNNVNVINEEGNDFFLKLGTSFERLYYTAHWRYDIAHMWQYKSGKHNGIKNNTLAEVRYIVSQPYFHATWLRGPNRKLGYGVKIPIPWKKGHHKTVLFPYGVSPFYFAYIDYTRSIALHKPPENMGTEVLDAWPGMSLRMWCKDDLRYAQILTRRMFNGPAGKMPKHFNATVLNIRDCYRNVAFNGPEAIRLLKIHDIKYPDDYSVHHKHIVQTRFFERLALAEGMMFNGLVQWQLDHRKFRKGDMADRYLVASIPLFQASERSFLNFINAAYPGDPNNPDRVAELKYGRGMEARVAGIERFRQVAGHRAPNLAFLKPWTVEH